eukprot:4084107-Prymnesium_polylepis.1
MVPHGCAAASWPCDALAQEGREVKNVERLSHVLPFRAEFTPTEWAGFGINDLQASQTPSRPPPNLISQPSIGKRP